MSDTIGGVMAVAGTDNTRACRPTRPVPILHVHARNDDHVLFEGGVGPRSPGQRAGSRASCTRASAATLDCGSSSSDSLR
jgi:poly(3-hydroxybutyrate) depolymerase